MHLSSFSCHLDVLCRRIRTRGCTTFPIVSTDGDDPTEAHKHTWRVMRPHRKFFADLKVDLCVRLEVIHKNNLTVLAWKSTSGSQSSQIEFMNHLWTNAKVDFEFRQKISVRFHDLPCVFVSFFRIISIRRNNRERRTTSSFDSTTQNAQVARKGT